VAALNTPIERASAQVFLAVLRDSLGARRAASDMLIPRIGLSALLPQPALDFIAKRGATVKLGLAVKNIARCGGQWLLQTDAAPEHFDAVIVATAPATAAGLLQPLIEIADIAAFEYEPITTCYLQYAPEIRLPRPLFALEEASGANCFGQFVFDRGQLDEYQAGLLAVVISAAGNALPHGHEALATAMAQQLANAFRMPGLSAPLWSQIISEKRAGFSCRPALARPANQTSAPGLLLAGDYTAGEYPATIEGAVRSGLIAARLSS
jgi:predicted NAD/FAD-dependent oxidoreductase